MKRAASSGRTMAGARKRVRKATRSAKKRR
jgi:hypothetical protein